MINSNINMNRLQSFNEMKSNYNYNNTNNTNANEVSRKDQSGDPMHRNQDNRTLYVSKDGHIFLETFGKYYKETTDFLVAIAEPVNRTQNIHEYLLTKYSLYAAASMNIKTEEIIQILSNLSKNVLPKEIIDYIRENTETYGKVKLILKNKRYFIECNDKQILKTLLDQPEIFNSYQSIKRQHANISRGGLSQNASNPLLLQKTKDLRINLNLDENASSAANENASTNIGTVLSKDPSSNAPNNELRSVIKNIIYEGKSENDAEERGSIGENFFEIDPINLEKIKKTCIDMKFPLLEEYDFKIDNLPTMDIMPKLKNPARYYQEKALGIMFSNNRARSGIIVLPCGAGKTLVGIMAATTIKRNTIILCNSSVSVAQWYRECNEWSITKQRENICKFTSKDKSKLWNTKTSAGILITTYTMMAFQGTRSEQTAEILKAITETEWGLMILDEVQVVPADMFRKILSIIKSHCKLGLTATLVREDKKIEDLNFLIGPKHYEANWLDLQKEGYLARVRCIEIWCEMNVDFYEEYLKSDSRRRMLLYVANPNKFYICKSLIEHHKNDKIIIFSDNLFCLKRYAHELKLPFISGEAGEAERANILDTFRNSDKYNCILMSKVGDTSIDLPNANVIIQISSHFGSRRQEAQRLGRILRPKKTITTEFNAHFYSIITKNTEEMFFSNKRHKFLVDQGYCFKVITNLKDIGVKNVCENDPNYINEYQTKLISEIKGMDKDYFEEESISDQDFVDEDRKDIKHRHYDESDSSEDSDNYDDRMEIDDE